MKNNSKIVVITGAESTGKSAMSQWLSDQFNAPFIPELARGYIENLGRQYNFADVEKIARQQVQQLTSFEGSSHPLIFTDTWLIITKIWFEEVFNEVPGWLEPEILKGGIDYFLVCDTDLPWVPDNVRENGGERRNYLQQRYIDSLKHYGFRYSIIKGTDDTRYHNAVAALVQAEIIKPIHI